MFNLRRLTALFGAALGALSLSLPDASAEPVDIELVLAVDVSLSMSPDELEIQRRGYAEALRHERVVEAIRDGVHGRIAVTYFEWAGEATQRVIVPWTVISNRAEAEAFADRLSANPPVSARRTSISSALSYAADLFAESAHTGNKRVVDVSGDGPNNQGPAVDATRNILLEQGITINGLPLMTNDGFGSSERIGFDVPDLDRYYESCVIGGPGAFMIPVNAWDQFPEAIRRKLVLELAGREPDLQSGVPVILAQADAPYDCQIGEKLWQNRRWNWSVP